MKQVSIAAPKLGKTTKIAKSQAKKDNLENEYLETIDFKELRRIERLNKRLR